MRWPGQRMRNRQQIRPVKINPCHLIPPRPHWRKGAMPQKMLIWPRPSPMRPARPAGRRLIRAVRLKLDKNRLDRNLLDSRKPRMAQPLAILVHRNLPRQRPPMRPARNPVETPGLRHHNRPTQNRLPLRRRNSKSPQIMPTLGPVRMPLIHKPSPILRNPLNRLPRALARVKIPLRPPAMMRQRAKV